MTQPVEMSLLRQTRTGPRNCARWRHLANTIKQSALGGEAATCQTSLYNYYYYEQFEHLTIEFYTLVMPLTFILIITGIPSPLALSFQA